MFTSEQFRKFADSWSVRLRFWCTYVPSGNRIIEWNHRTVKTIAARKDCTVSEAVYWYNITSKDDISPSTTPAEALHRYHVRLGCIETNPLLEREVTGERIKEGDVVWVKKPCSKCMTRYGTGHITECGLMVRPVTLRTCDRRHSCNHQWATRANRNLRPMSHHSGLHQHHQAVSRISAASRGT